MPTPEDLGSFVTNVDGSTRPDLIPLDFKIRIAIGDYGTQQRLETVFTSSDKEILSAYREAMLAADQADAAAMEEMYRNLCLRLDELDGESVASEVGRIDEVIAQRRDARARAFLASLSPEAKYAMSSEADRAARTAKGATPDLASLALQYPEFIMERLKQRCAAMELERTSVR